MQSSPSFCRFIWKEDLGGRSFLRQFCDFFFVFYLCSGFRVLLRSGGSEDFLENRGGLIEFWAFSILDGRKEKLMEVEALRPIQCKGHILIRSL